MKPPSPSPAAPGAARARDGARRWSRRWPWGAGLLLVLLIVAGFWPKPLPVETARVARGGLLVTVDEEGMTRVRNRYVISAPVAGQLRRIDWKAGAPVEAGVTPVAVLESSGADFLDTRSQAQAEARVRAAGASLAVAEAQRDRAAASRKMVAADFARLERLRREAAISAQEFDVAELRAVAAEQEERAAQFAWQVAQFELQQAQAVLGRGQAAVAGTAAEPLTITSPVTGRILRVHQESARVVPAGFALVEVGDPTDLEARIEVLSRDGVAVQPGARVIIEQWGGATPLEARVRWVEPSAFTKVSALGVEEQRVYVVADFVSPIEQRPTLGDNFRIEGRIVVWEGRDVIKVPAGALFQRGGRWQVFVVLGGRSALRDVTVGRSNGLETQVVSGLAEGETVVVYPGDKITDGGRVAELTVAVR